MCNLLKERVVTDSVMLLHTLNAFCLPFAGLNVSTHTEAGVLRAGTVKKGLFYYFEILWF